MAEGREVNTPSGQTVSDADFLSTLSDEQLESEVAKILDRGHGSSRLAVDLPPELHGEWVPNDPVEISRKQGLGFVIDDKYAPKSSLHSDGTGKGVVGDTIHMVCHKRVKEAYDKLALRRYMEANVTKQSKKNKLQEEEDFHKQSTDPRYINTDPSATKVTSSAEVIDGNVIAAAKQAVQNNLNVNTTGGTS